MQIDYALILSAGKGTRMGEIGQSIPKPLWPIFNKTLLELQLNYCQDLGIKKVFINTHYLALEIRAFLAQHTFDLEVIELFEPVLLDSGGAIHNFAQHAEVNYKGNVILINADQFLLFDKNQIKNSLNLLETHRACLFGINVDGKSAYNELVIDQSKLTAIQKHTGASDYITYSGLGVLKLDGLKKVPGISRFFESVTDYKTEPIAIKVPFQYEYWDFGTATIYHENVLKIALGFSKSETSQILSFLKRHNAIDDNFQKYCSLSSRSIDLESKERFHGQSICWKNIDQKV